MSLKSEIVKGSIVGVVVASVLTIGGWSISGIGSYKDEIDKIAPLELASGATTARIENMEITQGDLTKGDIIGAHNANGVFKDSVCPDGQYMAGISYRGSSVAKQCTGCADRIQPICRSISLVK